MQFTRSKIAFALLMIAVVALVPAVAQEQHYRQTNLVSDIPGLALTTDPDLVNPWGIVHSATSPWWVNDNGTGLSTLYNASAVKQGLRVTVPPPAGSPAGTTSAPTGIVFNTDTVATDFVVSQGSSSGTARFMFATEDGTISGWNPAANPTVAILEVPKPDVTPTAVYKGLAIATYNGATFLYAANFTGGKVEVFDGSWNSVLLRVDQFVDPRVPHNYHPFNVQNIEGNIFVTFAKFTGDKDEAHGRGFGFVDEFDSGGRLIRRLEHGKWLNAPWGVALAPDDFGRASHHLLVGNFGSGQIAIYDRNGSFDSLMRSRHGRRIVINGLWGLLFGSGGAGLANNGPANTLFFSAGIDDENHGLFGTLTAIPDKDQDDDKDNDHHDRD